MVFIDKMADGLTLRAQDKLVAVAGDLRSCSLTLRPPGNILPCLSSSG
jgi:hypothetical protein